MFQVYHFTKINENLNSEEKNIQEISKKYINYIKELNNNKKSSSKKFYIIIKNQPINKKEKNIEIIKQELNEKYIKIKECLSRCGNKVNNIDKKEEILKIFFSYLNTKKYLNKKDKVKTVQYSVGGASPTDPTGS